MDENKINISNKIPLDTELPEQKPKDKLTSISGIITNYKDPQILEVEKILNPNINNKPSLKEILQQKDVKFTKEYLNLNNLYSSLICYVKFFRDYDRGCLTVSNKNIKFELNKKLIKLKKPSYSDISEDIIKNDSTQKELPNYNVNDTIDKILTGKNVEKEKNKKNNYILDINLDLVSCQLIIHKEKQKFRLLLLGYKKNDIFRNIKVIKFNCINAEKSRFYHLCNVLNKNIILSEGYKSNKFGINFFKNYFTQSSIDFLNFVREANTGDILLFKNYSSKESFQRKIMDSEYNHISLIVKNNNNLRLYDCIQDINIRLINIIDSMSLNWNLKAKKIVLRKLNINIEDMEKYIQENNFDMYENVDNYHLDNMSVNEIRKKFYQIINKKVENFIINNSNAKYEFSICKYLCNSKKTINRIDISKKNKYFCSELVACVYMYCNIMQKKYDPSTYLPKDFTEKGKIEFINGFHFGEEIIIDFAS